MIEKKQLRLVGHNGVSTEVKDSKILRYSMQLAMLQTLLLNSVITQEEYNIVKSSLMLDYNISSNLMCKDTN